MVSRFVYVLLTLVFCASPVLAAPSEDEIQKAIGKGADFLRNQYKNHPGNNSSRPMGHACLVGLALLESGVREEDETLQNLINYVRKNSLSETGTYEVALIIMFLDRLGHEADRPVIQFLGVRLMYGQNPIGAWSYDCGLRLTPEEQTLLLGRFKESKLTGKGATGDASPKKEPSEVKPRSDLPVDPAAPPIAEPKIVPKKDKPREKEKHNERVPLHPEVAKLINQGLPRKEPGFGGGDNSNTQFAVIGLWCARKHGVPCDNALALTGKMYRATQGSDGGWSYSNGSGMPAMMPFPKELQEKMQMQTRSPAMTCAGLIGIAASMGVTPQRTKLKGQPDPTDDPVIKRGLKCLGDYISKSKGVAVGGPKEFPGPGNNQFQMGSLSQNLYFLWSLERTAMIYGLETIGKHDWYGWGAESLINSQAADGSWLDRCPNVDGQGISTSFALLFLTRANLARDLTTTLKGPGVGILRGGGNKSKLPIEQPAPKSSPADPNKNVPAPSIALKPDPAIKNPEPLVTGSGFEKQAAELSNALINAAADDRPALLARLRDSKGSVYTEALAMSAAKLTGDSQSEARDALARRLMRMTATTLKGMLKDENLEIRRAAAEACGLKGDKQLIADLIDRLSDESSAIVYAARVSLRKLSEKDFGPEADASIEDKNKAISAWKEWWKTQAK